MPPRPKPSDLEPMAQTTVRFPRAMLKRARIRAATDEVTLQSLLIKALDAELARREKVEARRQARRSGRRTAARPIAPHTYTCLATSDFVTEPNAGHDFAAPLSQRSQAPGRCEPAQGSVPRPGDAFVHRPDVRARHRRVNLTQACTEARRQGEHRPPPLPPAAVIPLHRRRPPAICFRSAPSGITPHRHASLEN